jgi:hypothetical protein
MRIIKKREEHFIQLLETFKRRGLVKVIGTSEVKLLFQINDTEKGH